MNKILFFLLFALIGRLFTSCQSPAIPTLVLKNNSKIDKHNEGVVITRQTILEQLGEFPANKVPAILDSHGQIIPFQLDDLNGDGQWEELFFVATIPSMKEEVYSIEFLDKKVISKFDTRTNLRFADVNSPHKEFSTAKRLSSTDTNISQKYFQMEGPAWENDKVAFRNYFDARNGIDIYGKRVAHMVLDSVGINGQNYHELAHWGMDILKVGTSLGAGAIALQIQDSVYRINYSENANFKAIIEGPLRTIFELNFPDWKASGRNYTIKHRISIQAGTRYYQSEVSISNLQGDEKLVSGLVNILNDTLYSDKASPSYSFAATHDKQAYDKEFLGMGLTFKTEKLADITVAPEEGSGIIQSHLIAFNIKNNTPLIFRSYACWEFENTPFRGRDYFLDYLKQEASSQNQALTLSFSKE